MMRCVRCNDQTPRLTRDQRYCPACEREVSNILDLDARRKAKATWSAKDMTTWDRAA